MHAKLLEIRTPCGFEESKIVKAECRSIPKKMVLVNFLFFFFFELIPFDDDVRR